VAALIELARSADYRDRADAGRCLASFVEQSGARRTLLALVLDANDTFVTVATAEALLRRKDTAGLDVVAGALAAAEFNQMLWIDSAVRDVFGVLASDRDAAVQTCETLTRNSDAQVRSGGAELIAMLNDIDPILHPAE
jgi:hypothetical protein